MADTQPLLAAFAFGIVANAASAAAVIYVKANGPPIFQDSLRLVLVIFLISSALWSVIDFAALHIEAASGCQVAVAFGAAFDQLARSSFQQFLLWGMDGDVRLSWPIFVPQLAVLCRFVLAGVYVGFQRSHFHPVCISSTLIMPLGVSLLGLDALILFFLVAKLMVVGDNNKRDSEETMRSKTMLLAVAAAGFWTAMSAPMTLGIKSLSLFLRKTLPAIGILAVIVIVLLAKERLLDRADEHPKLGISSPPTRHYRLSQLVSTAANRSVPRMSTFEQPSSRFSDQKQGETTTSVQALHARSRSKELPAISAPAPGQSERGIGGFPVQGQLFPPMRPQPPPTVLGMRAFETPQTEMNKRPKKGKQRHTGRPTISGPILRDDASNPLERIATVDLDTAARADEQRRAAHPRPLESHSVAPQGLVGLSEEELLQRSKSVGERKAVGQIPVIKTNLEPILESEGASKTSSAQLSPGVENMRQRSPRLSRQTPPPLPPLKTPGTVATLAVPSPAQPDVWDLLAVPKEEPKRISEDSDRIPDVPPRSPLREQPAERPSTSPAARSIALMTQTSQPDRTGTHRRSQSVSSKRSRPRDKMFTDTRTPPPIPEKRMNRKSFLPATTVYADAPPPYKFNGQAFASPQPIEANVVHVEASSSPLSKPESKLSLFPPSYSKNGLGSPKHRAEAAVKAALAVKPAAEAPSAAPPRLRNRAHTTANVTASNAAPTASPLRTTTLITPIDKPLPASPSIPNLVRESVLNRPRPITRTPETARFLTSYTHRPNVHRRSASCGSIRTKKSIVHSAALGSPSALPSLPPVPAEGMPVIQGFAGDTRSMTVDEKMAFFNPKSGELNRKRRSMSLPEIPQLPATIMSTAQLEQGPTQTARSTMTSVRTQSILNLADLGNPDVFRRANQSQVDLIPPVPVDVPIHARKSEETEARQTAHQGPQAATQQSKDTAAANSTPERSGISDLTVEETPQSGGASSRDSWEMDSSDFDSVQGEEAFAVAQAARQIQNPSLKASPNVHHATAGSVDNSWHNRLGSSPPSFSSRTRPTNMSRRGPPPHPLLLNRPPKILTVETEPSPLEEPEEALDMLEEQLQKLERGSRTSSVAQEQRMTLLADLEKEMGMQETNWHNLRHTIVRDSLSTVTTSPQQANQVQSLWAKVLENRGSRLAPDSTNGVGSVEGVRRLSQQRLSLLTVSHPTSAQLGSPTPPDTDEDFEVPVILDEIVNVSLLPPSVWRAEVPSPKILKQEACLWSPSASVSFVIPETLSLIVPPKRAQKLMPTLEIQSSRLWSPKTRLKKAHVGLWSLPVPQVAFDTAEEPERRQPAKPRPLTVRPPRKSKRITALPDILESPKPLSTRHDTLGIFQFPWGEKSHTGTIPPPVFGAMPGTMTSGRDMSLAAADPVFSRAVQDDGSFFDDRDEEDIGDNFSDFDDEDDGDDFDETTLWEIASLLKSDQLVTQTRVVSGEWLNSCTRRTSVVASPTESVESPQCATIPLVLDVRSSQASAPEEKKTLWERSSQFYAVDKGLGLKQPNRRSWDKYLSAIDQPRQRKGSRDELARLDSKGLWRIPPPVQARSGPLWAPQSVAQPRAAVLWEATEGHQRRKGGGLWANDPLGPTSLTSPKPLTGFSMRPSPREAPQGLPVTPTAAGLWFQDRQPVLSPDWLKAQSKPSGLPVQEGRTEEYLSSHRDAKSKAHSLWSQPEPGPSSRPSGTWQPGSRPQIPVDGSPQLQPRYERETSFTTSEPETKDINQQALWQRRSSSADNRESSWVNKSRKHRTFQEDVDTVQEYLNKRWGGM